MTPVRIAVLADIHGNAPALEAVLEQIEGEAVDAVYVLGDIVNGGPEPEKCWREVRDRADGILAGNHERYTLTASSGDPAYEGEAWLPARWTADRMPNVDLADLAALPMTLELDGVDTLLCHASPRKDDEVIFPDTPLEDLRAMLSGTRAGTIVRGHNHIAFERWVDGTRVIAIGAVGRSFIGPGVAEYAVLEAADHGWLVRQERVPYDAEATLRACTETGYLEQAGPVARLFVAEIATGRRHLSTFMRDFYRASEHESLGSAVDAFLR